MPSSFFSVMVAGLLPLAASLKVPVVLRAGGNVVDVTTHAALYPSTCILPESFEVYQFHRWTPLAANTNPMIVDFGFWDNSTKLRTQCHRNGNTSNIATSPNLAPRYACDNATVEFVLQNATLTVVEKVCPNRQPNLEAAGTVTLNLTCVTTEPSSPYGYGRDCLSEEAIVDDPFSSLNPTPPGN